MRRALLFIVFIVSEVLLAVSCGSNNDEESNPRFYYYPKKNMYYDVEKKNFLYSLDSARTWTSIANPSSNEPATLGEKIVITSSDTEVYKNNDEHRKLYGGTLYNIFNRDTGLQISPGVTERKAEQKNRTATSKRNNTSGKEKKGIKKLFEKFFGKKN